MHADPAKTCVLKILLTQNNFTSTKKFYVLEIAAVDLSKIYFLKNAKKTCEPNNRDLNRDWITDVLLQTYLNTHVDFRIFSCRVMNKFKLLIVIVVPNTKQTNWLHKQYHARTSQCFYGKFYHLFSQMQ